MRQQELSEAEFRTLIDEKDEEIMELISERFDLITMLTQYQLRNKFPILDTKRVDEVLNKYIKSFGDVEGRNIAYALIGNYKDLIGHDEEGFPSWD
jgi:chorismate mutase